MTSLHPLSRKRCSYWGKKLNKVNITVLGILTRFILNLNLNFSIFALESLISGHICKFVIVRFTMKLLFDLCLLNV